VKYRLHLGTIKDESYYDSFIEKNKYNKFHLKKICLYCNKVVDLGFSSKEDLSGFAVTLPHECKIWVDEAMHRLGYQETLLHYQGFLWEEKLKRKIDTEGMAVAQF